MRENLLKATHLTSGYNKVPALRDFSLSIQPGEVISLLGPNGAGKTTAMLSMVGLVQVLGGSVTAFGEPVRSGRPHELARKGIRLVPDDRGIFHGLNVREHLRLAQRDADSAREEQILGRFSALAPLRGRRVGLLSGGEQQMLAIVDALLARPRVLMIDEMSLGLAPKIVQVMLPAIRDMAKEEDIGVVIVEQHVELALAVSDRALVLNHGRVVLEGTATELLHNRSDLEAAYFGAEEFADSGREALPS